MVPEAWAVLCGVWLVLSIVVAFRAGTELLRLRRAGRVEVACSYFHQRIDHFYRICGPEADNDNGERPPKPFIYPPSVTSERISTY